MGVLEKWRYCPRCARELTVGPEHLACPACGQRYWGNPVPGVQAVVERDGRVLLGRRRDDPGRGKWDIPGGFLHEGEDAIAGLRREIAEETGLEIEPVAFLGTWNEPYWDRTVLCLTWIAHVTGGVQRPGDDLVELNWFARDERPTGAELAFSTFDEILSTWARQQDG